MPPIPLEILITHKFLILMIASENHGYLSSFHHIDLRFSVEQVYAETAVDSDAVGVREEDVADLFAGCEGMVGDGLLDTA